MPDRNGMLLSVNKLIHFLDKSVRHSHCKIKQKGKRARKTEKGSAGERRGERALHSKNSKSHVKYFRHSEGSRRRQESSYATNTKKMLASNRQAQPELASEIDLAPLSKSSHLAKVPNIMHTRHFPCVTLKPPCNTHSNRHLKHITHRCDFCGFSAEFCGFCLESRNSVIKTEIMVTCRIAQNYIFK